MTCLAIAWCVEGSKLVRRRKAFSDLIKGRSYLDLIDVCKYFCARVGVRIGEVDYVIIVFELIVEV